MAQVDGLPCRKDTAVPCTGPLALRRLATVALLALSPLGATAAEPAARRVDPPVRFAVAPALAERDLAPFRMTGEADPAGPARHDRELNPANRELPWRMRQAVPPKEQVDQAVEAGDSRWAGDMPNPRVGFPGVGNINGVLPPDTQGDVGPDHYVQWVNLSFDIFDKDTGTSVIGGPVAGNSLWAPLGGDCATTNDGDPVVLYDHLAGRWLMTQFTSTNHECLAVSQGADPATSGWFLYDFTMDVGLGYFPDYPKLGVWPDGYYYSANMFSGTSFAGAQVAVFERDAMLAGDPGARVVWFYYDQNVDWAWSLLPADLDGPAGAAVGAPNPFVTMIDNAWFSSGHNDELLLFDFSVDWTNTAASSFSGPTTLNLTAAGYAFDSNMCGYAASCIPQPGTSRGLDAISSRLMYRLQYRDFGSHETLLTSHTVDATGADRAGVRWYELRRSGGGWSLYQAATYAPDTVNRWMGDLAMDAAGSIAVGYSVSSGSVYPGIRWAGRQAADPLGSLAQGEATVIAGGGSQTHSASRWGDYSSMSVDPVDDCTFWYTQEYMASTSISGWSTWVASVAVPMGPGPASLTATPTGDNAVLLEWAAVTGASEYQVYRSTTSGSGYVQVATVAAPVAEYLDNELEGGVDYYWVVSALRGCYSDLSAEATARPGGVCDLPPSFAGIVSALAGTGTTCGIELAWDAATAACGGPVSYAVYRSASSGFTPSEANRIAVGLGGTSYSDTSGVASGTIYHYVVRATDEGNGQEDANTVEASAQPGVAVPQTLYANGFESGTGLADWATGWFVSGGDAVDWRGIQACTAATGSRIFRFGGTTCTGNYDDGKFSFAAPGGGIAVPPGATGATLSFAHRWQFESGYDGGTLLVSLDGATFATVPATALSGVAYNGTTSNACPPAGGGGRSVWTGTRNTFATTDVDLDAVCDLVLGGDGGCAGQTLWIAFTGITDCNTTRDGWFLDDVTVSASVPGACTSTPARVTALTATATSERVKLEWVNPSAPYSSTRICRDDAAFPADPESCAVVADVAGPAGGYATFTDTVGLSDGSTYYYAAFVAGGGAWSGAREVAARPFDTATSRAKWAYHTSASALAPTGVMPGAIGRGAAYAVSNDRQLHGVNPTVGGGDWPRTTPYAWQGPMAMNGPAEARPPVVPTTAVPGASQVVFLGSEDGHAYAADARTGVGLWRSPELAAMLLASPSGTFADFGAPFNRLFVGTRAATADNQMIALDPADGSVAWSFANAGGGGIGIISAAATVDPLNQRLYFASRARAGGSPATLWCLSYTASSATLEWAVEVGNVDGAPVLYDGRLYVGNNDGRVWAIDPGDGSEIWHYDTGDGMVKGFVTPQAAELPRRLYLSTSTRVWSLVDQGGAATLGWSVDAIPAPSAPLAPFGGAELYVGGGDGRLHQIAVGTGLEEASLLLGDGSGAIGSPALDVVNGMAYVGSEAGAVYGVVLPLD